MRRLIIVAALCALSFTAQAQQPPSQQPTGLQYLEQQIGAANGIIARLIDENATLKTELGKAQAELNKTKVELSKAQGDTNKKP